MNRRRIIADKLFVGFTLVALAFALLPLASIVFGVVSKGISSINVAFFTELPPNPATIQVPNPPGGLGDAVQGTLILIGLSCVIALPIAILSGVYIAEYGDNYYGSVVRFLGDVLVGIPSIVTGVLVYGLIVLTFRSYSVAAASIALGTMMIPIVSNTTSEALKAVPRSVREASFALGIKKWRTTLLVLANAKKAVSTGCLLAMARIAGETAPLLLVMGTWTLWYSGLNEPVAALSYYVYYFATSPFPNWIRLAWGAALVLLVIVLAINIGVRLVTKGQRIYA